MAEPAADPPSRWPVVVAFALVGAATQVTWLNYAGVTTVAAGHFGVSDAAVGWLANMFPLLYVVLAIPAGLVLDRWFRGGLAAGAALTAVGAAVRLVDDTYAWALAGQTLIAVAQPLVLNAVIGVAARYLRAPDRPAGISVGMSSTFAGMVLAFVLGALFPRADQLGTVVGLGAGIAVVAAVAMLLALRRPGEQRHAAPAAGLRALRVAAGDRLVQLLCLAVFFPFGTFIALTTFGQPLLEPAGVAVDTASLILLVNVLAGVAGCAVLPVWAARRGLELRVGVLALVASTLSCVALAVAPGVGVGFAAVLVIGFGLLPLMPIVLDLVERRAGEAHGTAAGLVWLTGNLGGLLVSTAVGLLTGRPLLAFLLMAACALVAVPLLRTIRPHLPAMAAPGG
ncbi:MAG: MFS transporter [Thermocrispum sp.]